MNKERQLYVLRKQLSSTNKSHKIINLQSSVITNWLMISLTDPRYVKSNNALNHNNETAIVANESLTFTNQ